MIGRCSMKLPTTRPKAHLALNDSEIAAELRAQRVQADRVLR
jgi:hypothetical protein